MKQNKSIDNVTISRHVNDCQTPPGYNVGGQKLGIGHWVSVGDDWYRWTGRNSVILGEAIGDAHLFTAQEWVEVLSDFLEIFTREEDTIRAYH